MATPERAYRAIDPQPVAASLDEYNEQRTSFFEAVKAFGLELGHEVAILGSNDQLFANHLLPSIVKDGEFHTKLGARWTAAGLLFSYQADDKVADIPPGWHYYVKDHEVRPYRGGRDKTSKAAVQELADLNSTSPRGLKSWLASHLGLPGGPFDNIGFEPVGDTFFLLAAKHPFSDASAWEGNEHFEPVPMSAYWLAKEQAEAGDVR